MITIYKITDNLGRFSNGGSNPRFSKTGKSWNSRGHVSLHLAQLSKTGKQTYKAYNAQVIEFQLTQVVAGIPVEQWIGELESKRAEKQQTVLDKEEQRQQQHRYRMYQELKAEFEK